MKRKRSFMRLIAILLSFATIFGVGYSVLVIPGDAQTPGEHLLEVEDNIETYTAEMTEESEEPEQTEKRVQTEEPEQTKVPEQVEEPDQTEEPDVMDESVGGNDPEPAVMPEILTETEEPEEPEREIIYDPQPATMEEVQAAITAYETEYRAVLAAEGFLAAVEIQKPRWQYEVTTELMPDGYNCQLVDWDEDFGGEYYTFFPDASPAAPVQVTTLTGLNSAISNAATSGTVIDITKDITLTANNTITLNGSTLVAGGLRVAVTIPQNKSITIMSSNGSKLIKTDTATTSMSYRHFGVKGELILKNITLTGNSRGGGIQVMQGSSSVKGGSLVLGEGAIIENCRSDYHGGGVHVEAFASLTMDEGAVISGCIGSSSGGGGVSAYGASVGTATFIMNGGKIVNNKAYGGAGVVVGSASFTMNGGEITGNNTTGGMGGGVTVAANNSFPSSFRMNGGTISGNTASGGASGHGGGVAITGTGTAVGTFTMYGGEITDNISTVYGGGVSVNSAYGTFTMYGNAENPPVISGNSAPYGGGVYVGAVTTSGNSAIFNMSGGMIGNNTAAGDGGGVHVAATSTSVSGIFNMTGGEIINNSAPDGDGGGIYSGLATYLGGNGAYENLTIASSAVFSGNIASEAYIYNGTPTAANIASRSASIAFPDNSTHPLNNYDINYERDDGELTFYSVTVEYVDTLGNQLRSPDIAQVYNGQTYTYTVPIDGYKLVNWKLNNELQDNTNPVNPYTVTSDTVITLIYDEKAISVDFSFIKADAATDRPLSGAVFNLYIWKGEGSAPEELIPADPTDLGWEPAGTCTSDDETGLVKFKDLEAGEYRLAEVEAPADYQLPTGQWKFTVNDDGTSSSPASVGDNKPPAFKGEGTKEKPFRLGNIKQYVLPAMGGGGTFWFAVLGGVLITGSMLLMLGYRQLKYKSSSKQKNLYRQTAVITDRRGVN